MVFRPSGKTEGLVSGPVGEVKIGPSFEWEPKWRVGDIRQNDPRESGPGRSTLFRRTQDTGLRPMSSSSLGVSTLTSSGTKAGRARSVLPSTEDEVESHTHTYTYILMYTYTHVHTRLLSVPTVSP